MAPQIQERINMYLMMWSQSDASARIYAAESLAQAHGLPPYTGDSVSSHLEFMLTDLVLFLAQDPEMLKKLKTTQEINETLIEIVKLGAEMNRYTFKIFDPRYRRAKKRLNALLPIVKEYDSSY